MAGQLGATYFIPTFVVPLLLITHGLVFRILLQHQSESAMRESRPWRKVPRSRVWSGRIISILAAPLGITVNTRSPGVEE